MSRPSRPSGLSGPLRRFVASPAFVLTLVVGAGVPAVASADSHGTEPSIQYRQKLMSSIGANMGAVGDILKNQLELPGHVENHAGQMAQAAQLIAAAFKQPASEGATDAKPEIWKDWTRFEEAIADFEKAAQALQAAATGGDPKAVGPAVKTLGDRCGDCHEPFRKPKEESYKNR